MTTETKDPSDEFTEIVLALRACATPETYVEMLDRVLADVPVIGNRMQAKINELIGEHPRGPTLDLLIHITNYLNLTITLLTIGNKPDALMGDGARAEMTRQEEVERATRASNMIQGWHRSGTPVDVIRARCAKAKIAYEEPIR